MAKLSILGGATSVTDYIFVQDSASTVGAGKTGLVYNTSGLSAYYVRPGAASQAVSLVTQTVTGAYSSGGFVEVDAVNLPGVYRIDYPNAMLAAGVRSAVMMLKGTGIAPVKLEIELTGWDNQVSKIAATLAASDVTGNLPTNVIQVNGTAQTARDLGASVAQTGDSYVRLGAPAGGSTAADIAAVAAKTVNLPASPAATGAAMTLTSAYDAAKTAASQTSVTAITTNTARGRSVVPDQVFRPASGTATYEFDLNVYTLQGGMDTPDAAPTVHARNVAGASLDASLVSTTMTNIATGRYKVQFTVAAADPVQEVLLDFFWAVGGVNFALSDYVFVVDVYAVDFTTADRTALNAIPINPLLASDTRLNHLNADISAIPTNPLLAANYTVPPTAGAIRTEMDTNSTKLDVAISTRATATALATAQATASSILTAVEAIPTEASGLTTGEHNQLMAIPITAPDLSGLESAVIAAMPVAPDNTGIATLEARLTDSRAALLDMLAVPEISPGPVIVVPTPPTANLQTLWGQAKELGTAWAVGDTVRATPKPKQVIGGVILDTEPQTTTVGNDGFFSLPVDKTALIRVEVGDYFSKNITVTSDDEKNLGTY